MGYILNFQNNSNNMKNEIIRKITSLTLMTIMFAGGMTLAVPSFLPMEEILPAAYAENDSTTEGMLTSIFLWNSIRPSGIAKNVAHSANPPPRLSRH